MRPMSDYIEGSWRAASRWSAATAWSACGQRSP